MDTKELKPEEKKERDPILGLNEGKEVQPIVEGEEHLDEHGRPLHVDRIVFPMSEKDLIFVHETIREVMKKGLVPPNETGPAMSLLEDLASMQSVVHKYEALELPVNYFVGMWHCLNTGRMFSIYSQGFKKKDRWLDKITMKIAESIDAYHKVKKYEAHTEKSEMPPEYFKNIADVKGLTLIEDGKKKPKKKGFFSRKKK